MSKSNTTKDTTRMKKYITPTVEFELLETADMMAGSGKVDGGDFTQEKTDGNQDVDGNLKPGDGTDFGAKQSTFVWDDDF